MSEGVKNDCIIVGGNINARMSPLRLTGLKMDVALLPGTASCF
jgi:hypothetical protein